MEKHYFWQRIKSGLYAGYIFKVSAAAHSPLPLPIDFMPKLYVCGSLIRNRCTCMKVQKCMHYENEIRAAKKECSIISPTHTEQRERERKRRRAQTPITTTEHDLYSSSGAVVWA